MPHITPVMTGFVALHRENLNLLNHVKMNGFSILTFHKPSFSAEYFKVILLYQKNSVP